MCSPQNHDISHYYAAVWDVYISTGEETQPKKIYEQRNKIVLQLRTFDKLLLSLGNYFVDIVIVYLKKHYDDIYSGFFMGGGWSWTTVWILQDFGKMAESQNKKIGHSKK
jgi:hypothetical protein